MTDLIKPLDDIRDVVELIARITNINFTEVQRRLVAEASEIGTNVLEGLTNEGIPPYVASDKLTEFYKHSDSFLYETTVWNTCRAKQQMRDFIDSRLLHINKANARIFCFGDGLGFDSAWLANRGHLVSYFEPSLRCQQYAQHVFSQNNVQVSHLQSLDEIAPGSLDAIVCLDVLEHIPEPQNLVKSFAGWLKPDGVLFAHAPFWAIHSTRPTHLKENRHLTGNLSRLYSPQGLQAIDSSIFWDPIMLQKSTAHRLPTKPGASFRLRVGQLLLKLGRWNASVHMAVARRLARAPVRWSENLRSLDLAVCKAVSVVDKPNRI